jgi:UDP-N-acetylglucosamine:LPS N-acetylglucosamine transferase
MRILFTTTRGVGHLTPLLPYARRLSARGHDVRFASVAELRDRIQEQGYEHFTLDAPPPDEIERIRARTRGLPPTQASAVNVGATFGGAFARAALPAMEGTLRMWRPDVLIRESLEYAGLIAALLANVPHAQVLVHSVHWEATSLLPHVMPALEHLFRVAGLADDVAAVLNSETAFSAFPEAMDGDVAERASTLIRVASEPDGPGSPGMSPWVPPDGKPLVYMTFGTLVVGLRLAKYVYRTGVRAVRGLPVRVLLTTGSDAATELITAVPDNVTVERWVPQQAVLPHAAAMVCHGGSGTVLGGLAAGVPMVVAPFFADQPDNAERVEQAGAGLAVRHVTVDTLRGALERVLAEPRFAERARQIAESMKCMVTVDQASDRILGLAA